MLIAFSTRLSYYYYYYYYLKQKTCMTIKIMVAHMNVQEKRMELSHSRASRPQRIFLGTARLPYYTIVRRP
jgi:hypothetical protein